MKKSFVLPILIVLILTSTACAVPFLAGSEDATESAPPVATEVSPTVEIEPTPAGRDECLQGQWTMNHESLQTLMAALIPLPTFHVQEGTLTMTFVEDNYTYASDTFVLRIDTNPGNYIEASASFSASGTFATEENEIIFNNTSSTSETFGWRAYINGEYSEYPGTPPTFSFGIPGSGPYTCEGDTLTVGTTGTANTPVPMVFTRSR